MDKSDDKTLDMSSILLDPSPPPAPQPLVQTMKVVDGQEKGSFSLLTRYYGALLPHTALATTLAILLIAALHKI